MSLFPFALLARGYARARLTSKQGNKDYFKGAVSLSSPVM